MAIQYGAQAADGIDTEVLIPVAVHAVKARIRKCRKAVISTDRYVQARLCRDRESGQLRSRGRGVDQ